MDKATSLLSEWTINFIKNKDIHTMSIKDIKKEKNEITIKYIDKEETYIVDPYFTDINNILEKKEDNYTVLVVLNKKKNLDLIIKNWTRLIKYKNLRIILVNPFSELEKKWILNPYFHNKVADMESLKKGLTSLFYAVDPIEEIESYLK